MPKILIKIFKIFIYVVSDLEFHPILNRMFDLEYTVAEKKLDRLPKTDYLYTFYSIIGYLFNMYI